ncbi:MAG: response regulator [Peptococcaceae bacterium]|nr:response regulator [Peptococcaceae bacterium]
MIRIMTVDDEPFFISDFRETIEMIGGDYQVVCEAYDAQDALQKIMVYKPDIVFIDIKLPRVDGISLLKKVREQYAYVIPIILSGYSDFNLAREALRAEAEDYLLKPIDKQQLCTVLKNKTDKVMSLRRKAQQDLLSSCLKNTDITNDVIKAHFNHHWYYLLMINGDPSKLDLNKLEEIAGCFLADAENYWIINQGAAEDNLLILFGLNRNKNCVLKEIAAMLLQDSKNNISSIIISDPFFEIKSLSSIVEKMKAEKEFKQVLGQPLTALYENIQSSVSKVLYYFIKTEHETKLHTALWTHHWSDFRQLLWETLKTFQEKKLSKNFIKKFLFRLTIEVEKNYPLRPQFIELDIGNNIKQIIEKATDFEALANEYLSFLMKIFEINDVNELTDEEKLMSLIENYLEKNITKNLSVNKICKHFRISQPKMNRIVRKYKNMSFVAYFTLLKIEQAKKILIEQPKMPINTLAYTLGFSDNLYFSKVFKKMTSYTPTQYRELFSIEKKQSG